MRARLADVIVSIEPIETPLMSYLPHERALRTVGRFLGTYEPTSGLGWRLRRKRGLVSQFEWVAEPLADA